MKKHLMINLCALVTSIVFCAGSTMYAAKGMDTSTTTNNNNNEESPKILASSTLDVANNNEVVTTSLTTTVLEVPSLVNFNNKEDFTIPSDVLLEMQLTSSNATNFNLAVVEISEPTNENLIRDFDVAVDIDLQPPVRDEISVMDMLDVEEELELEEEEIDLDEELELEEEVEPELEEDEPELDEEEPELEEEEPELEEEELELEEDDELLLKEEEDTLFDLDDSLLEDDEAELDVEDEDELDIEDEDAYDGPEENLEPDFSLPQIDVEIRVETPEEPEEPTVEDTTTTTKPSYVITTTEAERAALLDIVAGAVQREIVGTNTAPKLEYYEAYKAQAVACRSYMEYHKANSGEYPAMLYIAPDAKTIELVDMVLDEIMYYDSKPINATFHASAGGHTQSAVYVWGSEVPYLTGVESKYDTTPFEATMTVSEVESKLNEFGISVSGSASTWFDLSGATKTDGGFIDKISICGQSVTGRNLREKILGTSILRSPKITNISVSGDTFTFTSVGFGHGVGMSQNGALGYAKNDGYNYKEILRHYYTGVSIY